MLRSVPIGMSFSRMLDRHDSGLAGMCEVAMATGNVPELPAIVSQPPDNYPAVHVYYYTYPKKDVTV